MVESAAISGLVSANVMTSPPSLLRGGPAVLRREARLRDLAAVGHEAGNRGGRVGRQLELVGLEGVDGEDVAVRLVAFGRTRAAPGGDAVVDAVHLRALGQV